MLCLRPALIFALFACTLSNAFGKAVRLGQGRRGGGAIPDSFLATVLPANRAGNSEDDEDYDLGLTLDHAALLRSQSKQGKSQKRPKNEKTPAKKAAPAKMKTPAKKAAPAKMKTPAKKAAPAKKKTPLPMTAKKVFKAANEATQFIAAASAAVQTGTGSVVSTYGSNNCGANHGGKATQEIAMHRNVWSMLGVLYAAFGQGKERTWVGPKGTPPTGMQKANFFLIKIDYTGGVHILRIRALKDCAGDPDQKCNVASNPWGKSEAEVRNIIDKFRLNSEAQGIMQFLVSKAGRCFQKCDILAKWPKHKKGGNKGGWKIEGTYKALKVAFQC